MLKRTLQENDFKKEKNHFGIDMITSYRSFPYNSLNGKDPDKRTKKGLSLSMLKLGDAS